MPEGIHRQSRPSRDSTRDGSAGLIHCAPGPVPGAVHKRLKAVTCGRPFLFSNASMNDLDTLVQAAQADFAAAGLAAELENAKARYLGKGGRLTAGG